MNSISPGMEIAQSSSLTLGRRKTASISVCLLQLTLIAFTHAANPIKKIDTHCHYIPDFYSALLSANNVTSGGFRTPRWSVEEHIATMDAFDISLCIASASTPGAFLKEHYSINQSRLLARRLNEYGYNLTTQYPTRFRFFATLTLPDVEGSVVEAIYALDNLQAAGVILLANSFGEVLGSPLLQPLYAVLNERNATVFIHPSNSPCPDQSEFTPTSTGVPQFVVDFLLDTTRAAANLLFRNVTTSYPNINFILAHSGGFVPFATSRIVKTLALLTNSTESLFLSRLQEFYVDTAISTNSFALTSTLAVFSTSRLLYGTDFPFQPVSGITEESSNLETLRGLSKYQKSQIKFRNAAKLFAPARVLI